MAFSSKALVVIKLVLLNTIIISICQSSPMSQESPMTQLQLLEAKLQEVTTQLMQLRNIFQAESTARNESNASETVNVEHNDTLQLYRIGSGYDVHAFAVNESDVPANNSVVLGGVPIPYSRRIKSHSDGDVLLHALVDAILGSIAKQDIGYHFPSRDPRWKGQSSSFFLETANTMMKDCGYSIGNIDITIICEAPRLSKYREAMRSSVASILDIAVSQVSIKATTNDKLGFLGRKEGIAVQATVLIKKTSF